jgi:hypothetical protein
MSELTIKDKVEEVLRKNFNETVDRALEQHDERIVEFAGRSKVIREQSTGQIMQLIDSAITEARIEAAIMGAKFGNAAFRQQSIAEPGKPINLDVVLNSGIQQAQDWAKRTS